MRVAEPKRLRALEDENRTRQLDRATKRTSFELFRRNLQNPEIITFDKVLARAKHLLLNEQRDLARTGQPDRATLEALGLKPADVFQPREIPKAQEQQRPAVLRDVPEEKEGR